jgi:outer membrane receptor protein involved in Fe transport
MSKARWLLSAGVFVFATPAFAQPTQDTVPTQDSPTEEGAVQQDEAEQAPNGGVIIVTAQGRAQRLQDVPLAVSAVGQEQLQNSGATDIRALNQLAPSLLVSSTGTEANGSARIRGIGTVGDNPGLESSVAVFVDGVYRSRSGIGLNELGEVDRIEVLRGPQGTLFGRNASAGLIHIITRKPEFQFGGMAELTYGNYDMIRGQAAITGPLTQTIAARIDGVYVQRDGYYRVVNAAGGTESSVNDRDRYYVRGQLLFEPSDALSVRLIGDYSSRDESCCGAQYSGLAETTDPTPTVPGDFATSPRNRFVQLLQLFGGTFPGAGLGSTGVPENSLNRYSRDIAVTPGRTYRGNTRDWGISGQIDYDFGDVNLTSITAYRDYKSESPGDLDYGNVDLLYRADDGNAYREFQTFSQELRLSGRAFGGALDWLVGGYFSNEDLHVSDNLRFGAQYGQFSACGMVARVSFALVSPTSPGCVGPAAAATLAGAFSAPLANGVIIPGLVTLGTVNEVGDNVSNYYQTSRNYALFTHNIINITDQISLTLGLRYTNEHKEFEATFNNTNTACATNQARFSNVLPGGATPAPAAAQAFLQAIVNLTCQGNATSAINGLNPQDERSEDEFTGTAILSWRPTPGLLVYGSYSRGYKAGGFNLDRSALGQPIYSPTDPRNIGGRGALFGVGNLQFDSEINDAFEIGAKLTRDQFTLNVAAFHQRFTNFQLNTFNGSVFLVQNVNGCGASLGTTDEDTTNPATAANATGACPAGEVGPGVTSMGVEIEASLRPAPDLQVSLGLTYAETEYENDLVGRDTGLPLDQVLFNLPGNQLSNAPSTVVTASAAWTPEIGNSGIHALFYADARLTSDYNTGSDLFPEKEQDGYVVANARVGIRGPEQRWAIELWAQNLFNEQYDQVAFNTPFQGSFSRSQVQAGGAGAGYGVANQLFSSFLSEPRTYGVTGRVRF